MRLVTGEEPARDRWRGRVSYGATVECADCARSETYPALYRPVHAFLRLGWRKRAGLWRCPECARGRG